MTQKAALCILLCGIFLIPSLTGCSTMFKDEEEIESDKVALEHSRAQVFGASGAGFSPDGSLVAIGTRNVIWIADTRTHNTEARLSYREASRFGGKKSLLFIDNQRLVIGAEGAIYLYDLKERQVTDRHPLIGGMISPRAIAWSGNLNLLAFSIGSATEPVTLLHIDANGFGAHRQLGGFEGVPSDLKFSRDGLYLAATGDGQGVFIRDTKTGQEVGSLPTDGYADNLELFGKNRLMVSGENIALWSFLKEDEALELENANLQNQITSQVATRVAGAVALGTLTAFAAVTLAGASALSSETPPVEASDGVSELASLTYKTATLPITSAQQAWCGRSTSVSPDEILLVDVYPGITKEVIRVFDMTSGEVVKSLNPKGEHSCVAKFNPASNQLLITTDKVARLYNTQTWQHEDLRLGFAN